MGKTAAEAQREEGALAGQRRMLLRILQARFGDLPAEVRDVIEITTDQEQLERWADRGATAKALKQVGIKQPR